MSVFRQARVGVALVSDPTEYTDRASQRRSAECGVQQGLRFKLPSHPRPVQGGTYVGVSMGLQPQCGASCERRRQRCSKSRRRYLTLNIVTVLVELRRARIHVIILAINTTKFSVVRITKKNRTSRPSHPRQAYKI